MSTKIPLSKAKLAVGIAGSITFITLGYLMITDDFEKYNTPFTRGVGIVCIVFFGIALLFSLYKLMDKKPGLIIDEDGITDNSGAVNAGLIEWKDIISIDVKKIISTDLLIIHVNDPDKYINRAGRQKAWLMRRSMGLYGTPINISSTALKYNFDELYKLLQVNIKKHNGNRIA